MDAKNSPLALLAQTCSAIGADAPNPKLIANMEKSGKNLHKSDNSRDKSSPGSQSSLSNSSSESHHPKSSFKPYEPSFRDRSATTPTAADDYRTAVAAAAAAAANSHHHHHHHRIKTPKQMHLSQIQSNGRCDSNQSAASPRSSPATTASRKSSLNQQQPINLEKSSSPTSAANQHRASSVTSKESTSTPGGTSRSAQESPLYSSSKLAEATKESAVSYPKTSVASLTSASGSTVPPFFGAYGPAGLPYPMDLMAASALMSPHHAMLKAASMNPYLNYANRMKMPGGGNSTSNGTDSLGGCRDPFCTGCSLTPHPNGKCLTGCTQCDPTAAAAAASKQSYAHQMSQAFAHAQLAALAAASQMPYVCNWIAGDASYCGKRFSTSDELLQHLRTHTASMNPESLLNPATAGLPPTHPLLQRTYPTPPLSPLSGNRYHPYSKPLPPNLHPSLAGLPLHHPSLAPYFSPYSLYGRLGTSPSMHP